MKYSTALKLVEKLKNNEPVKLRGNKHNGISSITWCNICDVIFTENPDIEEVNTYYSKGDETNNINIIVRNKEHKIVFKADKITLF